VLTENHLEMGNMKAKIVIHTQSPLPSEFKNTTRGKGRMFSLGVHCYAWLCVYWREETPGSEPQVYWWYRSDPL